MPNIPPRTTDDPVAQYRNHLKRIERDREERERLEKEAEKEAAEAKRREKEAADAKRREENAKVPLAPVAGKSSYMNFNRIERERVMRENPGMSPTYISKLIGERWRGMTPEEKYKFTDEYALKVREGELAGLFGGKKRRRAAKKTSKKRVVRRRRTTRKH